MDNNRLIELINKYTSETLTQQEGRELAGMLEHADHQQRFQQFLSDQLATGKLNLEPADEKSFQQIRKHIIGNIAEADKPVQVIKLWPKKWWSYAAAVILFIGAGAYLWNRPGSPTHSDPTSTTTASTILPGRNKAILVLADESVVDLDSLMPGGSIIQGNMKIVKSADGELIYSPATGKDQNEGIFINTMKTPNGGQYHLTLPDGTEAWLNAASSITYPTRFTGNTRSVTVFGEIYLEVAKDKSMPFIVKTGQQEIVVLGTAFNINSYPRENSKISLIEGAVKVNGQLLKPGQAFTNGKVQPTNTSQDIAWRNGVFNFNDQSLQQVIRQISRWYDVKTVFEGTPPQIEFTGELSRDLTLTEVIDFLKGSQVNVEWKNNQLVIKQ